MKGSCLIKPCCSTVTSCYFTAYLMHFQNGSIDSKTDLSKVKTDNVNDLLHSKHTESSICTSTYLQALCPCHEWHCEEQSSDCLEWNSLSDCLCCPYGLYVPLALCQDYDPANVNSLAIHQNSLTLTEGNYKKNIKDCKYAVEKQFNNQKTDKL